VLRIRFTSGSLRLTLKLSPRHLRPEPERAGCVPGEGPNRLRRPGRVPAVYHPGPDDAHGRRQANRVWIPWSITGLLVSFQFLDWNLVFSRTRTPMSYPGPSKFFWASYDHCKSLCVLTIRRCWKNPAPRCACAGRRASPSRSCSR
jgi:hypothetical protein